MSRSSIATSASAATTGSRSGGAAAAMRSVSTRVNSGEHVGAEPAELVAADLGLGPRPDHRPVVLVEVGEPADPRPQRRRGPLGPGASGPSVLGEGLHLVGDLGHERRNRSSLLAKYR